MGIQNIDMMKKILQAKKADKPAQQQPVNNQNKAEGTGKPSIFAANNQTLQTQQSNNSASIFGRMNTANSLQVTDKPQNANSVRSLDPTKEAEKVHSMNPEDIMKKLKAYLGQ